MMIKETNYYMEMAEHMKDLSTDDRGVNGGSRPFQLLDYCLSDTTVILTASPIGLSIYSYDD